jgi:Nidogen-like/FecR protein
MLRSVDVVDGQHLDFRADGAAPDAGKTVIQVDNGPHGPTATIPDAHLLFNAEFKRAGSDLILNGDDGKTAAVHDYFASDKHPMLLSPEGAALAPDVVAALAGPLAAGQYAQATPAQANAEAIGRVATVSGNATIVRNGVAITVATGDAVLKGDVLQTGGGTMGVTFNDGSTLSLTANSRLVVNEFVFDPNGHANSEILSLVQGSLSMISGQVAHTGDMKIDTPVATMGIRGTVFGVTINAIDGTTSYYVSQSPTGGADLFDKITNTLLARVVPDGPLLVVHPVGPAQVLAEAVQKSPQELATELAALQHIVNVKAIGDQLIQHFFQQDPNNPNPQAPHSLTNSELLPTPNGSHNSNSGDTGDTGNTKVAIVHITTSETDQNKTNEATYYTVPIPPNLPPVNFAPAIAGVTSTKGVSSAVLSAVAAAYLTDGHDLVNTLGGPAGFGNVATFQPDYTGVGGTRSDDGSTHAINIAGVFGGGLNFVGHIYDSIYINSNGNITFAGPNSTYTPSVITGGVNNPIIAPFWADVDTRGGAATATPGGNSTGSNQVYYSLDALNHVITITWDDVGFYNSHTSPLNAFQLQLIGFGDGNFDIVYRYEDINWTAGDASGGSGGLGGTPARAGYSAGDGVHYTELNGSGHQSAMLALDSTPGNTGIVGVDVFQVLFGNGIAAPVAGGKIQFTDSDSTDTHTATEQANGTGYIGTFALDDPAHNGSNVTETSGGTPGSVDWHFNLTSSELNGLANGNPVTQSYNVTIDDGHAGGQVTQTVAISWGSVAADTFTFQPGIGADTVLNFQLGTDSLDFNNGSDSAHLGPSMTADQTNHILSLLTSNTSGDAVLDLGHGDTVTLAGISATDLQHSFNHITV